MFPTKFIIVEDLKCNLAHFLAFYTISSLPVLNGIGFQFLGIMIAFVFGFIQHFIEIRVMHDYCETQKTVKSKNNNHDFCTVNSVVCIVIKQSKTHNRIL